MCRREFLHGLAAGSVVLWLPKSADAASVLVPGYDVAFKCLGHLDGPRFLDGHTHDGVVGLAPKLARPFTGTKWHVFSGGNGSIALKCLGELAGNRWLDGRTHDGSVGLAPTSQRPFTGTRWQVVALDASDPNIVGLKCLGHIEGPRWLDGRTHNGSVGLAKTTEPPFTGTKWQVSRYPGRFDDGQ